MRSKGTTSDPFVSAKKKARHRLIGVCLFSLFLYFLGETSEKHSKKYTKTLIEEYQLVLVHGLLHLIGYSHDDPKKLSSIENTILKKVWNE